MRAEVVPAKAKRGETVTYKFSIEPKSGYWTYPIKPMTGQVSVTKLDAPPVGDLIFVTEAQDPSDDHWKTEDDPDNPLQQIKKSKGTITWEFKAVVSPKATPGKKSVKLGKITVLQVCDKQACIPSSYNDLPAAEFEVLDGEPVEVDPQFKAAVEKALSAAALVAPGNGGPPPGPDRFKPTVPNREQTEGGQADRSGRGRTQGRSRDLATDRNHRHDQEAGRRHLS